MKQNKPGFINFELLESIKGQEDIKRKEKRRGQSMEKEMALLWKRRAGKGLTIKC